MLPCSVLHFLFSEVKNILMSYADIFQTYISDPDNCKDLTLYDDEQVLIIKDAFPKSLRHFLIIPKSSTVTHVHPLSAFNDIKFYDIMSDYVQLTKQLIIDDLLKYQLLPQDQPIINEFKQTFIQCGVHSIPSLNNLHIHVMTTDFNSPRLKHKQHYNSFTTKFFVHFDKLKPDLDHYTEYSSDTEYSTDSDSCKFERDTTVLLNLKKKSPLKCSYCGQSFGNKFAELKRHLSWEFHQKFDTTRNCTPNG